MIHKKVGQVKILVGHAHYDGKQSFVAFVTHREKETDPWSRHMSIVNHQPDTGITFGAFLQHLGRVFHGEKFGQLEEDMSLSQETRFLIINGLYDPKHCTALHSCQCVIPVPLDQYRPLHPTHYRIVTDFVESIPGCVYSDEEEFPLAGGAYFDDPNPPDGGGEGFKDDDIPF